MMPLVALTALVVQSVTTQLPVSVRFPDVGPDGAVVFEANGDLWTADGPGGVPTRLTDGPSWDTHPAWSSGDQAVVFASDRDGGTFALWRLPFHDGEPGEPVRLTGDGGHDVEPDVDPEGRIVFVRGRGPEADLWLRDPSGSERRLPHSVGGASSPAFSPDGSEIVYVARIDGQTHLRLVGTDGRNDRGLPADGTPEFPAWSPDGDRIVYATRAGQSGVWITSTEGRYTNLLSPVAAHPSWHPGRTIVLAELSSREPSYNGDPQRLPNRVAGDVSAGSTRFWPVDPPAPPTAPDVAPFTVPVDPAYPLEAFDRVAQRVRDLYFPSREQIWNAHAGPLREVAERAGPHEIDGVIHRLIAERPLTVPEVRGRAAVSSAHPAATAAGTRMLYMGGNIVDAAVAVSFALGVVEPDASGIGGYGEAVVFLQGMPRPTVIEFLTRVPEEAGLSNASLMEEGTLPADGPVLANVPGAVAGMYRAWERYGSGEVAWAQVLEPAIQLAADGFVLDEAFATTLHLEQDRYRKYEGSRSLFFAGDAPLQAGDTLRNPDLAWTLREIASDGPDAFYRGEIARRMVEDLRGKGNAMTMRDLARYFAADRPPVEGIYRGHTIYSGAPAVSGGAALVSKLHLLANASSAGLYRDDAATLHAMIEAWKLQPTLRGRLADPSLWPVDYESAIGVDSAAARWERCFDPTRATTPAELRPRGGVACAGDTELGFTGGEDLWTCERAPHGCRASGTTAFAVADSDGNMIAVTQTLGTWGGNFYVTPGLGFLYNDKLGSYGSDPDAYNARLPFARNSTSIAPTLLFRGTGTSRTPFAALGAAGNAWITAAVYQVVTGMIDGGMGPQAALELPRFLVGARRDRAANGAEEIIVQIENGIDPGARDRLEAMGHRFAPISLRGELRMGYGAAVMIDGGQVRAGADPRRSGAAGAVR